MGKPTKLKSQKCGMWLVGWWGVIDGRIKMVYFLNEIGFDDFQNYYESIKIWRIKKLYYMKYYIWDDRRVSKVYFELAIRTVKHTHHIWLSYSPSILDMDHGMHFNLAST